MSNVSFYTPSIPEASSLARVMMEADYHSLYRTNDWRDIAAGPGTYEWNWANDRFKNIFPEYKLSLTVFNVVQQLDCDEDLKLGIYYASAMSHVLPQYFKQETNEAIRDFIAQDLDDANDFLEDMENEFVVTGLMYWDKDQDDEYQQNDFLAGWLGAPEFP